MASRLHLPLFALATLATWALTIALVRGMNAGPGTDLGGLASFIGVWVTMMGAMMLPSVAPMVLTFAHVNAARARHENPDVTPTWIFVATYIGVWTGYGLAAYVVFRLARNVEPGLLAWDRGGRYVAGGAIVAAALYELTPVKEKCLRHCRSPLHFLAHSWRDGTAGAVRLGAHHGLYCVGCCFGLFVILFAVGAMSLFWMVVIATIIFVEKVLPFGTVRLPVRFGPAGRARLSGSSPRWRCRSWPASGVRTDARPSRAASASAARGPADRVRAELWTGAGRVPGRVGGADAALGRGGGACPPLRCGRCQWRDHVPMPAAGRPRQCAP